MPKKYYIRQGFTFADGDKVLGGGEPVELEDDVVGMHLHKLDVDPPIPVVQADPVGAPAETADPVVIADPSQTEHE